MTEPWQEFLKCKHCDTLAVGWVPHEIAGQVWWECPVCHREMIKENVSVIKNGK